MTPVACRAPARATGARRGARSSRRTLRPFASAPLPPSLLSLSRARQGEPRARVGLVGAEFQLAIMAGSLVLGGVVDRTKAYKRVILRCLALTLACLYALAVREPGESARHYLPPIPGDKVGRTARARARRARGDDADPS